MAYIFDEPMSGYTTRTDLPTSGWSVGTTWTYSNTNGRHGVGGLLCNSFGSSLSRGFTAVTTNDSVYVQFAIKWELGARVNEAAFLTLYNDAGTDECLRLIRMPNNSVRVHNAAGAVAGTSAGVPLVEGVWHVICVKAEIGKNPGLVDVYVNDLTTPALALPAVNLTDGVATGCDMLFFTQGGNEAGSNYSISDIFVWSSTAGPTADWDDVIGDKRSYLLLPTAEDGLNEWTPFSGTDNALMVDDPLTAQYDSDITYVSISAANKTDELVLANLPIGIVGIIGVVSVLSARKTDAGAEVGALSHRIRSAAIPATVATGALTTGYNNYAGMFLLDPDGNVAWTKAKVDALIVGFKVP